MKGLEMKNVKSFEKTIPLLNKIQVPHKL